MLYHVKSRVEEWRQRNSNDQDNRPWMQWWRHRGQRSSWEKTYWSRLQNLWSVTTRWASLISSYRVLEADLWVQSFAVANKAIFHNCLVAMQPATTNMDLPSAHDISTFIHNSFIKFFDKLRVTIQVMPSILIQNWKLIANVGLPTQLNTTSWASITTNLWSVDQTKAAFMGVTTHWIEEGVSGEWRLGGEVIAFKGISGPHTGYNLGHYLVSLCERAGILTKSSSKVSFFAFIPLFCCLSLWLLAMLPHCQQHKQ